MSGKEKSGKEQMMGTMEGMKGKIIYEGMRGQIIFDRQDKRKGEQP